MALPQLIAPNDPQSEKNARKLKAVELVILTLLLRRLRELAAEAKRTGLPPSAAAAALAAALHGDLFRARRLSRTAGRSRLAAEAKALGVDVPELELDARAVMYDSARARQVAESYSRRWLRALDKAERQAQVATAIRNARSSESEEDEESEAEGPRNENLILIASAATLGSLKRIAATENASAFTAERDLAADELEEPHLFKVWNASLDKACPYCFAANGTVVELHRPFPQGIPGEVHPHCRCSWTLINAKYP